jgi:DNA-binding winged helix-turn-helix (wHTH) protein
MTAGRFRFDRFLLDIADRQLRFDDAPVELSGRYFDALVLLVREQGKLVSKDRFFDEVWRGVPVTDEALTQCIRTLRRQLGDSAAGPRFIETVPKHGYRFIASVAHAEQDAPPWIGTAAHAGFGRELLLLGGAGTLGAGGAGVVGGLIYGFIAASQPLQPGMGTLSVLLVLLCVTTLVALLGGAGVAFGVATAQAAAPRAWQWRIVGGAAGGMLVGAIVKLLGLDAFGLLLGQSPGDITGAPRRRGAGRRGRAGQLAGDARAIAAALRGDRRADRRGGRRAHRPARRAADGRQPRSARAQRAAFAPAARCVRHPVRRGGIRPDQPGGDCRARGRFVRRLHQRRDAARAARHGPERGYAVAKRIGRRGVNRRIAIPEAGESAMNPTDEDRSAALIARLAEADRRAAPRTPTALTATIRASGEVRRIKGEVADVSVEGCKIFTWGLHEGDEVWIAIAHLAPMPARVCWSREGVVGLKFKGTLHQSLVTHLGFL